MNTRWFNGAVSHHIDIACGPAASALEWRYAFRDDGQAIDLDTIVRALNL